MCELAVVGKQSVISLLTLLVNELVGKKSQAQKVIYICEKLSKNILLNEFIKLCELTDSLAEDNDSKGRTQTAAKVKNILLSKSL
jgi:hypothetical protein